jgi:hypothetical protein
MSTVALHFVDLLNHINFISVIAAFVSWDVLIWSVIFVFYDSMNDC